MEVPLSGFLGSLETNVSTKASYINNIPRTIILKINERKKPKNIFRIKTSQMCKLDDVTERKKGRTGEGEKVNGKKISVERQNVH
jgi:predicted peptidase